MEVQVAGLEDRESLIEFLSEVLPDSFDKKIWEWKYLRSPGGHIPPAVAYDDGRIVGHLGMVAVRFMLAGSPRVAAIPADFTIHPDYRTRSLGASGLLNQLRAVGFGQVAGRADLAFMIPIPGFYSLARRHLKYEPLQDIDLMECDLGFIPALARRGVPAGLRQPIAGVLSLALPARARIPRAKDASIDVREADPSHELDELLARIHDEEAVGILKDFAYLRWRYVECPRPYRCLIARRNGIACGFLAFRSRQDGDFKFVRVLDLLIAPQDQSAVDALLIALLAEAHRMRCDVLQAWSSPQDPLKPSWHSLGCRASSESVRTLIDPAILANREAAVACDSNRWRFAMGDADAN